MNTDLKGVTEKKSSFDSVWINKGRSKSKVTGERLLQTATIKLFKG